MNKINKANLLSFPLSLIADKETVFKKKSYYIKRLKVFRFLKSVTALA